MNLEWTTGPALPSAGLHSAGVTSKLFDKFLVTGSALAVTDNIYELTCTPDDQECQWTIMDQTLNENRFGHLAFIFSNSEFSCF